MFAFFKTFTTHHLHPAFLTWLGLRLLATPCSSPGVALNGNPVVVESACMELSEEDQERVDAASLDDATAGFGLWALIATWSLN